MSLIRNVIPQNVRYGLNDINQVENITPLFPYLNGNVPTSFIIANGALYTTYIKNISPLSTVKQISTVGPSSAIVSTGIGSYLMNTTSGVTTLVYNNTSGRWKSVASTGTLPMSAFPTRQSGQKLIGGVTNTALFGTTLFASADGRWLISGTPFDNSGYGTLQVMFKTSPSMTEPFTYEIIQIITPDFYVTQPGFGYSVCASDDASIIFAGGPYDNDRFGATWIYTTDASLLAAYIAARDAATSAAEVAKLTRPTWIYTQKLVAYPDSPRFYNDYNQEQGSSVACSATGDVVAIGAPYSSDSIGNVHIFRRSTTNYLQWVYETSLQGIATPLVKYFGARVSMSADGNVIMCNGGGFYTFQCVVNSDGDPIPNSWTQFGPYFPIGADLAAFADALTISRDGLAYAAGNAQYDIFNLGIIYVFSRANRSASWVSDAGSPINAPLGYRIGLGLSMSPENNANTLLFYTAVSNSFPKNILYVSKKIANVWTNYGSYVDDAPPNSSGDTFNHAVTSFSNDVDVPVFFGQRNAYNGVGLVSVASGISLTRLAELTYNSPYYGVIESGEQGKRLTMDGAGNTLSTYINNSPGFVPVFERTGETFTQTAQLDYRIGGVVAPARVNPVISPDGNQINIVVRDVLIVYSRSYNDIGQFQGWKHVQTITPIGFHSDPEPQTISLSGNGQLMALVSTNFDVNNVYERVTQTNSSIDATWVLRESFSDIWAPGSDKELILSNDGNMMVVRNYPVDIIRIYRYSGTWQLTDSIAAFADTLGKTWLSADGNTILETTSLTPNTRLLKYSGGIWTPITISPPDYGPGVYSTMSSKDTFTLFSQRTVTNLSLQTVSINFYVYRRQLNPDAWLPVSAINFTAHRDGTIISAATSSDGSVTAIGVFADTHVNGAMWILM